MLGISTQTCLSTPKKAVRLVCKTKYNAHTDPLFLKLKTLKVKDIFLIQCLKFFFNHEKKSLPDYFHDFIVRNIHGHTHDTRRRNEYRSVNSTRITTDKTLRYFLPKFILSIPRSITNSIYTHSLQTVKRKMKSNCLATYQENCTIQNCYVCSRN